MIIETKIPKQITTLNNIPSCHRTDDLSNIYVALNGYGNPNVCPGGGEIRKYDEQLNLIWTKV